MLAQTAVSEDGSGESEIPDHDENLINIFTRRSYEDVEALISYISNLDW
jgi:hypothetical protein